MRVFIFKKIFHTNKDNIIISLLAKLRFCIVTSTQMISSPETCFTMAKTNVLLNY